MPASRCRPEVVPTAGRRLTGGRRPSTPRPPGAARDTEIARTMTVALLSAPTAARPVAVAQRVEPGLAGSAPPPDAARFGRRLGSSSFSSCPWSSACSRRPRSRPGRSSGDELVRRRGPAAARSRQDRGAEGRSIAEPQRAPGGAARPRSPTRRTELDGINADLGGQRKQVDAPRSRTSTRSRRAYDEPRRRRSRTSTQQLAAHRGRGGGQAGASSRERKAELAERIRTPTKPSGRRCSRRSCRAARSPTCSPR